MKKIVWGSDPEFTGPRDWYKNSLIIRELKNRKQKGKVLDFGSGNGDLLIRLAKEGFSCYGIDASNLAVKHSEGKIKKEKLESFVQVERGNEKKLLKLREKFNVVVCGETLEHLENDLPAVKGFYRVLKEGGICIVSVPAHQHRWTKMDEYAGHYRRYDRGGLKKLFKNVGFSINKIFYWGFPIAFIWDSLLLSPLINLKVEKRKVYTNSGGFLGKLFSHPRLKRFLSIFFWIDQMFNWSELGTGLILVATK